MNHLSRDERDKISILHAEGKNQNEIALILGRHKSTISREMSEIRHDFLEANT